MSEKEFGWKENIWWVSWSVLMVLQIIAGFFRYNREGLLIVALLGWIIMIDGFVIGSMGVSTLKKMGEVPKGKSSSRLHQIAPHGTTVLVDSGIYAAVRHPQYLCWIFFNTAVILIAQDWVVAIIGFASMLTIYMQAGQDDQSLVKQFGDDYKRYMQKVPRMNLLVGVIRLLRRRKREQNVDE